MSRPRVIAVVPSAGYGKRLGLKKKKPFVLLGGKPIASYALKTLGDCPAIDGIIIAAEEPCIKHFKRLIDRYAIRKVIDVVVGGRTRAESVRNCLDAVGASFDIVLIHDAARPFVDRALIEKSIKLAAQFGGCIAALEESDTVKLADENLFIKKTLDRNFIFRAQTPQAFRYGIIKRAYAACRDFDNFTDDASLAEAMGIKVRIVKGSCRNIKITTKEDLKLAEVLL
ncbi:MAG: 2-C-methyl-D-erythritol 4-phosphate cytidylyltransferase [Candidatus Omnitrophota bacterium]|jgi:2-C-methyl-D-erythritol 4-phosphate cytidylyltransferase